MVFKKLPRISAFAGTIAVGLGAWLPAALSGSPSKVEDKPRAPRGTRSSSARAFP
jgi:hypothetical protein